MSLIGSIFAVLTSIFGFLALAFGRVGSKAIANDHLEILRQDRTDIQSDIAGIAGTTTDIISKMKEKNDSDHVQIEKDILEMKGDTKAIVTDISWIKTYLLNEK